jgi:hypothetical protein
LDWSDSFSQVAAFFLLVPATLLAKASFLHAVHQQRETMAPISAFDSLVVVTISVVTGVVSEGILLYTVYRKDRYKDLKVKVERDSRTRASDIARVAQHSTQVLMRWAHSRRNGPRAACPEHISLARALVAHSLLLLHVQLCESDA